MKTRVFLRRPEVPGFWPSMGAVLTVIFLRVMVDIVADGGLNFLDGGVACECGCEWPTAQGFWSEMNLRCRCDVLDLPSDLVGVTEISSMVYFLRMTYTASRRASSQFAGLKAQVRRKRGAADWAPIERQAREALAAHAQMAARQEDGVARVGEAGAAPLVKSSVALSVSCELSRVFAIWKCELGHSGSR